MSLLLVPATRENLEKSIEQSVDIEFARNYLQEEFVEDLLRQSRSEGIRCWALTKNRRKLYDDIANGDEVLLTEKGTGLFTHYGVIIGKTQNVSFGKCLWPISGDYPWEYIYFLANIQKICIDKNQLVVRLGYKESFAVPGSIMAKNDNYEAIGTISKEYKIPVFGNIAENNDFSASNIQTNGARRQGHANFSEEVKTDCNSIIQMGSEDEIASMNVDYLGQLNRQLDAWLNSSEGKNHEYRDILAQVPKIFYLLCKLVNNDVISEGSKSRLAKAITYFILQFDLMPEAIIGPPGYLDDLIISALAIKSVMDYDSKDVVRNCWEGSEDIISLIAEIINKADDFVGPDIHRQLACKIE
jgi:uncharacterized membrane protein YkvA (DUF1232 family)